MGSVATMVLRRKRTVLHHYFKRQKKNYKQRRKELEEQKVIHTHEEGPNKENSMNEMGGGYNREHLKIHK